MIKAGMSIIVIFIVLTGCRSYDYTAFNHSKPRSILVVPPVNQTVDINAVNGVYAQVTRPLAESGYYVFPVTLVNETFKQNGIVVNDDIRHISLKKLHDIFGADAVLYVTIKQYGTSYYILFSETKVTVSAVLVDTQTGRTLWEGSASASSAEEENNYKHNPIGALVSAVVGQITDIEKDDAYYYARVAVERLLEAKQPSIMEPEKSILYGPRSPYYK